MNTITLEKGIELCREIEDKLKKIGYHCGLTGSILYKGSSEKDVDLIVYPHKVSKQLPILDIIRKIGASTDMYQSQGNQIKEKIIPSCADKLVVICYYKGIRFDLFFLT